MEKNNSLPVLLLDTAVPFAFALFFYVKGDVFLTGVSTGLTLSGLFRFAGQLISRSIGGEAP